MYIAPTPLFSGLKRSDDRMFCIVKVFGSVFIFGTIAAADMAASKTEAQVDPRIMSF
jgi:hypothetical protein